MSFMNAKRARPVDDPKALVPFGWAPGDYHCAACAMCGEAHSGSDKRSMRCQDCAETLRDAPTPMTHPLTPREKVAQTIRRAIGNARVSVEQADFAADRVLTALASGSGDQLSGNPGILKSGDHAELARLAEAATPGPWSAWIKSQTLQIDTRGGDGRLPAIINWPGFDGNDMSRRENGANARFIAAANPATVLALLAENAALRAANTEAERKLAEAVGLNDRAAELMRQCTDPERFEGVSTLNVYANMRAWLSDLPPAPGAEDE